MARGIFSGLILGSLVSGGILVLANELIAPVQLAQAEEALATPDAPSTAPEAESAPQVSPVTPSGEAARTGSLPEAVPTPTPEAPEDVPQTEHAPASVPQIGGATRLEIPALDEAAGVTSPAQRDALLMPTQPATPQAPVTVDLLTIEELSNMSEVAADLPQVSSMPGKTVSQPEEKATFGDSVGSFTDRDDSRKSERLPTISGSSTPPESDAVETEDKDALTAYSAAVTTAPSGPLLSIVLIDAADLGVDDEELLKKLPFPVTFAVDVTRSEAAARASGHRDNGAEVLAMVALPDRATPQDVAVTMAGAVELMPEVIGFLDVPSASYQATRDVAAQVVALAQEGGHGIVSFPRGLNALEQEAARASNAPVAMVFRDFDGRGQDMAAIKRFLDQAAFRAGIDGEIVVVGRAQDHTIQALTEWALGQRAENVSIVPASYLLTH